MTAYYNENDPYAAEWLRNLIAAGRIAEGVVDDRSIAEVTGAELAAFDQCHFFAGIGGWPLALRLAGWGDSRPVWTGSCPCQPFSAAGKGLGENDPRHLWPEFHRLISECRPPVVFGEQVASAAGREWMGGKAGLRRVRDAKTVLGVLQEHEGRIPKGLYQLLEESGAGQESKEVIRGEGGGVLGVSPNEASEVAGLCGQGTGEVEANGFQPRCPRCGDVAGDYRWWSVPGDRDTSESGRREDLGQPIHRQDQQFTGLREGERSDCSVLPERNGERVGREQGYRNCKCGHGASAQRQRTTSVAFGGIVKAAAEYRSLAGVRADLEALGYAVGAADLCAASAGAPHIRQRLWWVADADHGRHDGSGACSAGRHESAHDCDLSRLADTDPSGQREQRRGELLDGHRPACGHDVDGCGEVCGLEHAARDGRQQVGADGQGRDERGGAEGRPAGLGLRGAPGRMGDATGGGCEGQRGRGEGRIAEPGPWSDYIWLPCADGKTRRIEPGLEPLAHGIPNRVGRLRGYGNAIVPEVAAEFIQAFEEAVA